VVPGISYSDVSTVLITASTLPPAQSGAADFPPYAGAAAALPAISFTFMPDSRLIIGIEILLNPEHPEQ
jgi:hypothetical protein